MTEDQMGRMSNRDRAEIAGELLDQLPDADQNATRENVIDLLTNLRHFCDYALIDFNQALARSEMHWEAERTTDE
jgi:NTP pyrophosphatase (non-canonical NTP hydrolase)